MDFSLADQGSLPALAALHAAAFPKYEAWDEASLSGLLAAGCLVLWVPAKAFIMLRTVLDEAEIITLVTRPDSRRLGLARGLVLSAVDACRSGGVASLFLEVSTQNAPALSLYDSLGFSRISRRLKYYQDQSDAIVMRLDVSAG